MQTNAQSIQPELMNLSKSLKFIYSKWNGNDQEQKTNNINK